MKNKNNYSFAPFLNIRDQYNDIEDNLFLQKLVAHYAKEEFNSLKGKMKALTNKVSSEYRQITNELAKPENQPKLKHFNAYNQRIDRIMRPREQFMMEEEIFKEALFSEDTTNWEQFLKRFALHHNGEAGVMCPVACTDGLVDILRTYESELSDELREILLHCTEGIDGDYGIGAQFMTEIQGGSNIPANVLRAVQDGEVYYLFGTKFFCSAIHADYAVVTARVDNTEHVGLFVVPLWKSRDRKERNHYEINRLKRKLGTSELPSAELIFNGAKAYRIGPIDRGIANAVGIVLTKSRLDIGAASSAFMMRAVREALQYSQFREVFGRKIEEFSLAKGQLLEMEHTAKRTTAAVFKIFDMYFQQRDWQHQSLSLEEKKQQFLLRELILLQKIKAAQDTVGIIRTAISIFGGNGVIEDFSSLPRLFRDAMVNELWEGPKNVLLAQIHRDMKRASSWYLAEDFVRDLLSGVNQEIVERYQRKMISLLNSNLEAFPTEETIQEAREWERLCDDIFFHYQQQAWNEVGDAPIVERYQFKE